VTLGQDEGRWLAAAADAAFLQAAWKVVEQARQTGTPIVIWEDGRIVEISSEVAAQRLRDLTRH
jgi:hypothetical protein